MGIRGTFFRGIGLGYFKQTIKTIQDGDVLFDVEVKNYIVLCISIAVYRRVNCRIA
jgi:hypothetical protein